ncbi:MAG TPA: restriction endonuclease subunit S [Desulfobacteraceae bacterium]|nr:restriction endonuclease subunit S [Desulfobacteraceae bacterium]
MVCGLKGVDLVDRNENRAGYKKTKVGWIPEEWDIEPLNKVATVQTGLAKGKKNIKDSVSLPYLRVANVQDGFLHLENIKKINVEKTKLKRYLLQKGDVLFTEGGDFDKLGRGTIWNGEINQCLHQNHIFAVRCNRPRIQPYFLSIIAAGPLGRRYFLLSSKQSTNLASINTRQLKSFPLPLPPLSEQKKIAEILSTWDKAIDQTRKLIIAKTRMKKALMQQLIPYYGCKIKEQKSKWTLKKLGELIQPVSRPTPKPDKPYLSIGIRSHGKGTFQKMINEPEQIMMDTLYRIKEDDLVVNITFAWEGAIAIANEQDSDGLVSHRFPIYRIKRSVADLEYVKNLIHTKRFIWDLGLISPGGAGRNRVMNKSDFLKIQVFVPPLENQKYIGQILSKAEKDINVSKAFLYSLEKQKRGLMQKLLTGEIRVKV